jgi:hypothetical protein
MYVCLYVFLVIYIVAQQLKQLVIYIVAQQLKQVEC